MIDIGTNSTRLLICRVENGTVHRVLKLGEVTRLGEGIAKSSLLSRHSIERTAKAVERFLKVAESHGVEKVVVVTTEAVRRATNVREFTSALSGLGVDVEILPDSEEAELVFYANLIHFRPSGMAVTVDLGGGSTEVVCGSEKGIEFLTSFKFGVVTLQELFLRHDPPAPSELSAMENFIRRELSAHNLSRCEGAVVYAVGGTITSVVAMELRMKTYDPELVHGYPLECATVNAWYEKVTRMSLAERKQIVGLEEKRADVIVPGLAFFKVFCSLLPVKSLVVSELGLLYGIALREAFEGFDKLKGRVYSS